MALLANRVSITARQQIPELPEEKSSLKAAKPGRDSERNLLPKGFFAT